VKHVTKVQLDSFLLETRTDNKGYFAIQHGLEVFRPGGYQIEGIVISVQHKNQSWYSLEISNAVGNRFWWNQSEVQGFIASPNFYLRPVKVIILALFING
jgi:hypothetical protein